MSQSAASSRYDAAHSQDDRQEQPGDSSNKYPSRLRVEPGLRHSSAPVMHSRSSGVAQSNPSAGDPLNTALYIGDMHWWTSDQHIRELCLRVGIDVPLRSISFSEHKVNGKSKGLAFVDFESHEMARKVQSWLETHDFQSKRVTTKLGAGGAGGAGVTPFRTLPKEPHVRTGVGNATRRDENSPGQVGGQSRARDSGGSRSVSDSVMWRQSKEAVEPSKSSRGNNTKPAAANNNWRSRA
ncbi:BZ3500_MvSof-1268-A1-R1_Chr1-3g01896 [Microbotryum saponariae]|uniref:BZ3500_MvSof-1268-A1-R1_Chr1-3g01896 protein n=1 Tax=Microbotryum saponariae TaxID=289078 RepID=A0A2X0KMD2_9BASI|nr:BZ3500_MvSof-1268-A1-R1_Chr1-3g01896 [Microbotryum saponariae]SCZ94849.1 BZ3501_MvSof-1269-A2-R1_Chr1-3g01498 [Microbotryum saponariae]